MGALASAEYFIVFVAVVVLLPLLLPLFPDIAKT